MELKVDFREQKPFFQNSKRRYITMRIAICDDEEAVLCLLRSSLYRYANSHRYEFVIDKYYSGETLLASSNSYAMVFLDYKMGKLNGLDTAKCLRERNAGCEIVFITSYTHFVFDAFKVNAFRFLLKPVEEHKVYEALDGFFRIHGNDHLLIIKSDYETVCLNTKDIVYLEADNKRSWIHTTDRNIHVSKTMASVARQIPRNHFYKVNRAFIVNFNYICRYDQEKLTFKTGESVSISRNYLTAFKVAYRKYSEQTQRV